LRPPISVFPDLWRKSLNQRDSNAYRLDAKYLARQITDRILREQLKRPFVSKMATRSGGNMSEKICDRRVRREWSLNLLEAGKCPLPPRMHPNLAERQHVVRFDGTEDGEERFSYWLHFPNSVADKEEPASQQQYDTVVGLYGEGPASRAQASYLISAWYYADEINRPQRFSFSAPRRKLILLGVSAYILSHPELRLTVQRLSALQHHQGKNIAVESTKPFQPVMQFANDLIADMQGAGAKIFG
jgi:hypothetical protein